MPPARPFPATPTRTADTPRRSATTSRRPHTIAVVPTYHPDASVESNVSAVARQVDKVIVVDDGSGPAANELLSRLPSSTRVIRLDQNAGIARALNVGVRAALADGADFIVNIDQDTRLPDGYVASCLETFSKANPVTHVGIVCSDKVNGHPSIPTWYSPEGLGLVPEAIQSGFVISRECFEYAGLFDERLVIDCVDTEYCLRVRDRGFRIAVASGTDISHALGEMVPFRPFGIPLRHRNGAHEYQYHSPLRQYYITRNNIDLVFRNARRRPRWTLAVIKRQIEPTFDAVVSGPHRGQHAVAVAVGAAHGLLRIRGPIPRMLRRFLTN